MKNKFLISFHRGFGLRGSSKILYFINILVLVKNLY